MLMASTGHARAIERRPQLEGGQRDNLLSRDWAISVVAEFERLNDEAAASPIVEEDSVLGWFAGVSRRF